MISFRARKTDSATDIQDPPKPPQHQQQYRRKAPQDYSTAAAGG
ncbi:hypothetical protein [Paenibacillus sp. FSL E2-0178]